MVLITSYCPAQSARLSSRSPINVSSPARLIRVSLSPSGFRSRLRYPAPHFREPTSANAVISRADHRSLLLHNIKLLTERPDNKLNRTFNLSIWASPSEGFADAACRWRRLRESFHWHCSAPTANCEPPSCDITSQTMTNIIFPPFQTPI
jgi:hypothetical protein